MNFKTNKPSNEITLYQDPLNGKPNSKKQRLSTKVQ